MWKQSDPQGVFHLCQPELQRRWGRDERPYLYLRSIGLKPLAVAGRGPATLT